MDNFQNLAEHILKSHSNVSCFMHLKVETRNLSLLNGNFKGIQACSHLPKNEENQAFFQETAKETFWKLMINNLETKRRGNRFESFLFHHCIQAKDECHELKR